MRKWFICGTFTICSGFALLFRKSTKLLACDLRCNPIKASFKQYNPNKSFSTFFHSFGHSYIYSFVFRLENIWQSCSNDNSKFQQARKTHAHTNWLWRLDSVFFLVFVLMLISFRCAFFSRDNVLSWSSYSKFIWLSQR